VKIEQCRWDAIDGWRPSPPGLLGTQAHLVFAFGSTAVLSDPAQISTLQHCYPHAHVVGCSTSGEICGTSVHDDGIVITALTFAATPIQVTKVHLHDAGTSLQAGGLLANQLDHINLCHVIVLADGLRVNGSALVQGLTANLPPHIVITGGLAGDGAHYGETVVCLDGPAERDTVVAIGFYGDQLEISYGSGSGWTAFGPERKITHSDGNVLYSLDGQSALALYQHYLSEYAAQLPASGLLFPLSIRRDDREGGVVRTILGVNEAQQSITFAGDVPEGAYVRLMRSNVDGLIEGATHAAESSAPVFGSPAPELALLISCVGRKQVLNQRVEEEVEAVSSIFGPQTMLAGFYSYGEISPFQPTATCELHNQTMTITTLRERQKIDRA
jgi:hypothetical protein